MRGICKSLICPMLITDDELKSILLKTKIIDQKKLDEVADFAKTSDTTLENALIEKDIVTDENLGMMIADYIKIPFISLTKVTIPEDLLHIIPERLARKEKMIPFGRDGTSIKVATANPHNTDVFALISQKAGGAKIIPYFATERDINNALKVYQKDLQKTFQTLTDSEDATINSLIIDNVPVARIVDMLITYAYQDKASDIHIEPEEKDSLVRFRIDGVLHDVLVLPKPLHERVITRIKVLSRLRTDEHLSAQDGKMRMKLEEENLDLRVSIVPIVEGEKAVLRLLSSQTRKISLVDLGMSERDLKKVQRGYAKSYGMILLTGPTGSGKTTSIYAILKILNTRDKNITTVEDPVEYRIKGLNQINVNAKTNLTFAAALRSILRQDPNIIFVGEIRDNETAGIAVNAALTGHLVLSTLHTNDAATALPRLTDMKVEPFLVASTVNVIIGQRLIRKICDMCKTSITINAADLLKNIPQQVLSKNFGPKKQIRIYQGKGCQVCHFTGYSGRIGIYEVLEMTPNIRKLIAEKMDSDVIAQAAIKDGMTTMMDDGLEKVLKGETTVEEVLRATKVESV